MSTWEDARIAERLNGIDKDKIVPACSTYGHIEQMAKVVAEGARDQGEFVAKTATRLFG